MVWCDFDSEPIPDHELETDLQMHVEWVPEFLEQMTSLEAVHIRLYIFHLQHAKDWFEETSSRLDLFTSLRKSAYGGDPALRHIEGDRDT